VCYDGSLFFSFAGQFGFECCSLAQEMSSVICYLPCFREWLIIHLLSIFLPFQCLFTDSAKISPLPLSLSLVHFQGSHPSAVVLDYSSLFVIQGFFWGVSLSRSCAGLSWGWLGKFCVMPGAHLFGLWNVS
jgi:hypothetical protein